MACGKSHVPHTHGLQMLPNVKDFTLEESTWRPAMISTSMTPGIDFELYDDVIDLDDFGGLCPAHTGVPGLR